MLLQRYSQLGIAAMAHAGAGQNDKIHCNIAGDLLAEDFTRKPLDAISINRTTKLFLGNGQAEAGEAWLAGPGAGQHGKEGVS